MNESGGFRRRIGAARAERRSFLLPADTVFVPPRYARLIDRALGAHCVDVRGRDPVYDGLLMDLRLAGTRFVASLSAGGPSDVRSSDAVAPSTFDGDLLSAKDVAERLRVTPHSVTGLARRMTLKGRKVGREWVFDPVDVAEFIEQRETKGA